MFCGLCEEGCPTEPKSIWLTTKTYELASYDRWHNLYVDMDELENWKVRPVLHRRGDRLSGVLMSAARSLIFFVFAAIALAGAVGVITLRNPMYSAISLLSCFLAVAVLFLLRHAEFLGDRAALRLRRRHHGAVPVRDHAGEPLPAQGAAALPRPVAAGGDRGAGDGGVLHLPARRRRLRSRVRQPGGLRHGQRRRRWATRRRWPGASTATTCCRSRSPRSSCWWR